VQVHGADGRVEREIPTDGTAADVTRVAADLPAAARVTVRRASLDDVFLQLTGAPPSAAAEARVGHERAEVSA
jgi:ABC-2 type transport system ATP-binding protein